MTNLDSVYANGTVEILLELKVDRRLFERGCKIPLTCEAQGYDRVVALLREDVGGE